ncbi:MAG: DUF3137 domain-containing protein [Chloroflexota bacterium]
MEKSNKGESLNTTQKEKAIREFLSNLEHDLTYNPQISISAALLNHSGLFSKKIDRLEVADGIEIYIGQTKVSVAKLKATRPQRQMNLTYGGIYITTIFEGMLYIAKVARPNKGRLLLQPKDGSRGSFWMKAWKRWGGVARKWFLNLPPRHRLEESEFNDYFQLYGGDPIKVSTVLSPHFMQGLMALRERFQEVTVAVDQERIYIAISTERSRLIPNKILGASRPTTVRRTLSEIGLMVSIVNELHFSERSSTDSLQITIPPAVPTSSMNQG